jgi:hypothetical protein
VPARLASGLIEVSLIRVDNLPSDSDLLHQVVESHCPFSPLEAERALYADLHRMVGDGRFRLDGWDEPWPGP